jgi:hypothetical protein
MGIRPACACVHVASFNHYDSYFVSLDKNHFRLKILKGSRCRRFAERDACRDKQARPGCGRPNGSSWPLPPPQATTTTTRPLFISEEVVTINHIRLGK